MNPEQLYNGLDRDLDGIITEAEKEIERIHNAMENEVLDEVGRYYRKHGELTPETMRVYDREDKLKKALAAIITAGMASSRSSIYASLRTSYRTGFNATRDGIEEMVGNTVRGKAQTERVRELIQTRVSGIPLSERIHRNRREAIYQIQQTLGRGVNEGKTYKTMAEDLAGRLDITKGQAKGIVATETHRIIEEAKFDAVEHAINQGIEHKKYWRNARDERVRKDHRTLGNKYPKNKPIDATEPFIAPDGSRALKPGGFGVAAQDIRCRCIAIYLPIP